MLTNRRGYWPSPWPVECGANHRPKASDQPGLNLLPTEYLVATTRHTGRWPVMFVHRNPGELYLYGTSGGNESPVAGWVERVDPISLEPTATSGPLPAGGHEWCGSIAVHGNGDLYVVNGSYLHRLDRDCRVVAERRLPVDQAHNGLLILADGMIVTKDLRLGEAPSAMTVLTPDLEVTQVLALPEASMGRIAAVADEAAADGSARPGSETLYVPGATAVHRLRWDGRSLSIDNSWQPRYRSGDRRGLAWDVTVVDGYVWLMDNGNIDRIERRFTTTPARHDRGSDRGPADPAAALPGPEWASWSEPVRLIGISTADGSEIHEIVPFADQRPGWVLAPPLVHDGVALVWDSANMGLSGLDIVEPATPIQLWRQPFRTTMQPLVFTDTGEVALNDFRILEDGVTSDDLVILDLRTGSMKGRVATGATRMNAMFLTPGGNRDLYYCTSGTVARIHVAGA